MPQIVPIVGVCMIHTHPMRSRLERLMREGVFYRELKKMIDRERANDPGLPNLGLSTLKNHREQCMGLEKFDPKHAGAVAMRVSPTGVAPEVIAAAGAAVATDDSICGECGRPKFIPTKKMLEDKLRAELYRRASELPADALERALARMEKGETPAPLTGKAKAAKSARTGNVTDISRVRAALG